MPSLDTGPFTTPSHHPNIYLTCLCGWWPIYRNMYTHIYNDGWFNIQMYSFVFFLLIYVLKCKIDVSGQTIWSILLDHFHAKMYTKPAHIKIKYCMVWNVFLWIGRKIPSIGRWMQTHRHTHLHTCLNRSPFPCQASLVSTLWSCWLLVYWYKLAGKAGFRRAESVAGFVGGGSCF